jgi:hypothetical protein
MSKQLTMWTCQYCGKDTFTVDIDYLHGNDHLSCALEAEEKAAGLGTPFPDRRLLLVEVDMIKRISNDQELGTKVRQLYYETYNS